MPAADIERVVAGVSVGLHSGNVTKLIVQLILYTHHNTCDTRNTHMFNIKPPGCVC